MYVDAGRFVVRLADCAEDVAAAQRLRYRVFVEEMGATASPEDAAERRERDRFDPYFDHLLLIDRECPDADLERGVVGVYRVMRSSVARAGIGFYGAQEYELGLLLDYPSETLELGRSCVDAGYRGGTGMHLLWTGLGHYVAEHDVSILFGVASFHGTDTSAIAQALSYLHHNHLAPEDLRVRAVADQFTSMDILPEDQVNRMEALRQIPALIKAYIRLGGFVGEGAYIDWDFNTIDVCLIMDTARMVERYRTFYTQAKKPDSTATAAD
ncbi:GNAT family N-acetyltransferase [Limibaculum sp. M0105]|uniref:L-ornithine N(alpha)-acyltransferase n=1 Tax=Thermohalobaculum xanthum TaxID=2753746 RepID=A0A8J7M3Q9_9RHOB|nr:GNAT family N-acyltransferase [Thermohalobaculum xanthum]MBK0397578.1 GNAT family N-acetyltransferase [Thermohalobaculum xanthum]